ncbi:hypothetical protein IFO70_18580 [Phormidium tenue FACHB-886]|nr:hypothetical protein [Phormidium tenue FACHB-886]
MPGLSLIQQGDPVALAAIFNRSLQLQDIQMKARRRGNWLHLLLESEVLPAQSKAVAFVQAGMRLLEIESIQKVTVYGRRRGDRAPAWQQTIVLQPIQTTPAQESDFMEPATTTDSPELPEAVTPEQQTSAAPQTPEGELPNIFKRPEAVAFILFCSLVLFWDAYIAVIEETSPQQTSSRKLTSSQLAHRLKTSRGAVRSMRHQNYFSEWTRNLDPEKIAWSYRRGVYVPK